MIVDFITFVCFVFAYIYKLKIHMLLVPLDVYVQLTALSIPTLLLESIYNSLLTFKKIDFRRGCLRSYALHYDTISIYHIHFLLY